MAFKFKDLMINVTSGGGGETPICTVDTVDPKPAALAATCTVDTVLGPAYGFRLPTGICTVDTVRPNAFATVTTVTTVTTLLAAPPGTGSTSLAQLKAQLQQALADVERQEREQQAANALPATVEEADDLERRLQGAIQELRDHRKALEKGAKKESPKPRKGKK